jgi:hypothetical protein
MGFVSVARELRRGILTILETHHDEFSDFLPHSSSRTLSRSSHGPNHRSYGFGSRENNFVLDALVIAWVIIVVIVSRVSLIFLL